MAKKNVYYVAYSEERDHSRGGGATYMAQRGHPIPEAEFKALLGDKFRKQSIHGLQYYKLVPIKIFKSESFAIGEQE